MADQPTGIEEQPGTADEGIRQIPAAIRVEQPPTVTEARDKLLAAIGAEAQLVSEKSAGQASAALVELARAYALVTPELTPVATLTPRAQYSSRIDAIAQFDLMRRLPPAQEGDSLPKIDDIAPVLEASEGPDLPL
ncbi:hypothetical protein [Kitasatospora sp. NPDC059599]|uniref:hypothetical protein n=1 Tax=Kitasatospora sp. NPDC059599 TaxID=3346880 RepID=UPI0036C687C9